MIDPKRLTEADTPEVKPNGFEAITFIIGGLLLFVGLWSITPALAMTVFGLAALILSVGTYYFRRMDAEHYGGTE